MRRRPQHNYKPLNKRNYILRSGPGRANVLMRGGRGTRAFSAFVVRFRCPRCVVEFGLASRSCASSRTSSTLSDNHQHAHAQVQNDGRPVIRCTLSALSFVGLVYACNACVCGCVCLQCDKMPSDEHKRLLRRFPFARSRLCARTVNGATHVRTIAFTEYMWLSVCVCGHRYVHGKFVTRRGQCVNERESREELERRCNSICVIGGVGST